MVEYNRLISEQSAPAERRVESRKDRGDKEKGKCREKEERGGRLNMHSTLSKGCAAFGECPLCACM